ncbi:DUF2075 domain-containing protein [Streptomyces griseocarneus]|uniref:DUF2075 domain-containing protein n=2 Tax=Streptomyces TaxID=1883 RepID=A0ABX7RSA4_9ACTN|nr:MULTISPECIES: DUF2075 domain-containing protein [Streptomyces]QSY50677.1 DUF2075 domain-containing protein [Streptomyces griseocarneus]
MPMLLLKLSANDLLTLNDRRRMVPHLAERWKHFRGKEASLSERSAWAESLVALAGDMVAAGRGNVEMIVECSATVDEPEESEGGESKDDDSKRKPTIDVVLVGRHPESSSLSVQLVELKRWSTVTRVEEATSEWVHVPGIKEKKKHPALQLAASFQAFASTAGPLHGLSYECGGFAYLHNATEDSVRPLIGPGAPTGAYSRVYTQDRRAQLMRDLREHFSDDEQHSHAEILLARMNLRNTPLLDAMITSRGEDTVFTLRGRQRKVAEHVVEASATVLDDPAREALVPNPRRAVFVVTGGAGTGKSAIGLQLKAQFEAEGRSVKYASGSRAFNGAMQAHVGYGDREFRESFTYFSNFVTTPEEPLDVLICDEAHRLRERSTNRRWAAEKQGKRPQVDELLDASRLSLFFLDEGQSVRPNDVGTVALIEDAARRRGSDFVRYDLREQYRCGGSDAYVRWVRDLLGVSGEEPEQWVPDGLMHIEVSDTPEELEQIILQEARAGASARMVAGFCWPWTKPRGKEKRLEADVRIGDWHRPWNAYSESFCENGEPPSKIWSVHDGGLGQIGCVYTAQGLEWDWCGVIMGDDMVRRDDRWVFQRGKQRRDKEAGVNRVAVPGSLDPEVRKKNLDDDEFARCVRHAYHVLLTRASRATVLYSTDPETREYLKKVVGDVQIHGLRPTRESIPPELRVAHQPRPGRGRGRKARRRPRARKGQQTLF